MILRRAVELRVDASDWKGADGDKRSGKLPAVEIQRGKSVAEARIVLVPPVETPEVGVAAERFDRSLAPWKLLGTRKTNPKRAKNLRPAAGNKKGAQQEHGGYFARFDLVLCLAWIGYQIMLCRFVPFLLHVACVDTLRGVRYALRFTLHSKLRHERAGQALHG